MQEPPVFAVISKFVGRRHTVNERNGQIAEKKPLRITRTLHLYQIQLEPGGLLTLNSRIRQPFR